MQLMNFSLHNLHPIFENLGKTSIEFYIAENGSETWVLHFKSISANILIHHLQSFDDRVSISCL